MVSRFRMIVVAALLVVLLTSVGLTAAQDCFGEHYAPQPAEFLAFNLTDGVLTISLHLSPDGTPLELEWAVTIPTFPDVVVMVPEAVEALQS